MSDDNASPILTDVLERIDKLTQHIIEVKSDMYRRSEFQLDAARIYDTMGSIQTQVLLALKEAVVTLDKRLDQLESRSATKEAVVAVDKAASEAVPRTELVTRWDAENKRMTAAEGEIRLLKARPYVHPVIIGGIGAGFGGAVSWVVQQIITHTIHFGATATSVVH